MKIAGFDKAKHQIEDKYGILFSDFNTEQKAEVSDLCWELTQSKQAVIKLEMIGVIVPVYCPKCGEFQGDQRLYANVEVSKHHVCNKCEQSYEIVNPLATNTGIEIQGRRER